MSVSVVNMVTVCALYAHVIAFAAAFAKVGNHEKTHVVQNATTLHRKTLTFLLLLLLRLDLIVLVSLISDRAQKQQIDVLYVYSWISFLSIDLILYWRIQQLFIITLLNFASFGSPTSPQLP